MDVNASLEITYKPLGNSGKVLLCVRYPDGKTFTDKLEITIKKNREACAKNICQGRKGINKGEINSQLEAIAAEIANKDSEKLTGEEKESQADKLIMLCDEAELFHTPGSYEAEVFATVAINEHKETWPIGSKAFRYWLSQQYFEEHSKAPGHQALEDAIATLKGKALHRGETITVANRIAFQGNSIYLDLINEDWQVVKITPYGWSIVEDCPIKFTRKYGQQALPNPVSGGSIDELRPLVNLESEDSWMLFVAWLLAAFRPGYPFPILAVNGEQGSAKSSLCRMARDLIDPNKAGLRRPPLKEHDLMIASKNGWVLAYDNLSGLRGDMSDALCTLATGGGFATRELYTDDEEKLFDAIRPIMINGIEDVASRSDLIDRCICLTLPTIPEENRKEEEELRREFEAIRPRILGALLDCVSFGLRNKDKTKLPIKPRMADFATWIVAIEPSLNWPKGMFLRNYMANRTKANVNVLESSIHADSIIDLIQQHGEWEGTAKELLSLIEDKFSDEAKRRHKDWPKTPRKLSGILRRLAPNLRRQGFIVTFGEHTSKGNTIRLSRIETYSDQLPHHSALEGNEHCEGVLLSNPTSNFTDSEVTVWVA